MSNLKIKCPDAIKCVHRITSKHFEQYCCGKAYSPFECYWYINEHPPTAKTPSEWIKGRNIK